MNAWKNLPVSMSQLSEKKQCWYVYIIKATNDKLYTGITTDYRRRFNEHLSTNKKAKFFHLTEPEGIIFLRSESSRSSASQLEYQIKRKNKAQKLLLVNSSENQIHKIMRDEL
ncbi:GIY-YIG nuclease family protein [Aliikangiella maris]|uniref:GIY-YIG nuclease family protein n=2 Tax=Aliikangiella maris TaxID=3162458 RepID=A0ABV2BVN2_9GAMM